MRLIKLTICSSLFLLTLAAFNHADAATISNIPNSQEISQYFSEIKNYLEPQAKKTDVSQPAQEENQKKDEKWPLRESYNSRTRILEDGQKQVEIHGKWVNYLDEKDQWQEIKPEFVQTEKGFKMTNAPFEVLAPFFSDEPAIFNNNNRYNIETKEIIYDQPLEESIQALGVARVLGEIQIGDLGWGETQYVVYPNAFPKYNADLIYWVHQGTQPRLRKFIRFNQALSQDTDFQFKIIFSDEVEVVNNGKNVTVSLKGSKNRGNGLANFYIWDSGETKPLGEISGKGGWSGKQDIRFDFSPTQNPKEFVLTKHIGKQFFQNAILPVFTDATTTFYPDADPETTSVDGYAEAQGTDLAWSTIVAQAGSSGNDYQTQLLLDRDCGGNPGVWNDLSRLIFLFNTSSLGATVNISSASLSLYGNGKGNGSGGGQNLNIVSSNPSSNTALVAADYNLAKFGSTRFLASDYLYASWANSYNSLTLNSSGISNINKTGISKFGARDANDIDNSNPGCTAYAAMSYLAAYSAEDPGTTRDPKLTVTYTVPITVGTTDTQTANLNNATSGAYVGGAFTLARASGSDTVTSIKVSETGTINAQTKLANIKLYYETAGICTYDGNETLFGTATAFNSSQQATITGSMAVGTSQVCVYVVMDILCSADQGETIEIEITNPSTDVLAGVDSFTTPATSVAISGTTTVVKVKNVCDVYYSVGQSQAPPNDNHMTGTPTMTLTQGLATFNVTQTGNIGVGDAVNYGSNVTAYISQKVSQTQWRLVTATGLAPPDASGQTVNSIKRTFTSLSGAIAGISTLLGGQTDLVANNYIVNLPCYYDTGPDTTAVTVDSYTTGANNYTRIYTPYDTAKEVNQSQRHSGKWDDSKYRLELGNATIITISDEYVRLDGLQIKSTAGSANGVASSLATATDIQISNNIIVGLNSTGVIARGIYFGGSAAGSMKVKIWNNIVYDWSWFGIQNNYWTAYIYNNVVVSHLAGGSSMCFVSQGVGAIYRNNIAQGCSEDHDNGRGPFGTLQDSSSSNNIVDSNTVDYGAFGVQAESGTTNGAAANKLIQSGQDFLSSVKIGMIVKNTTDSTYTYVTAIDSDIQLSIAGNIMASGKNYIIYTNRYHTVSFVNSSHGAGENYHLLSSETVAINSGTNLSTDSNLAFVFDIDNQRRGNIWDIGADENNYHNTQVQDTHEDNLTNSLVLYQSFDGPFMDWSQTSGQARDKSGQNPANNGTVNGSLSQSSVRAGKLGQALNFNGSNSDYTSIADSSSMRTTSDWTRSLWIKPASVTPGAFQEAWTQRTTTSKFLLRLNTDGNWNVYYYNTSAGFSMLTAFAATSDWQNITVVKSGSNITAYKNGVSVASASNAGNFPNDSHDLYLGTNSAHSASYFSGLIDEVRVYNRALSASEITSLYRLGGEKVNMSLTNKSTNGLVGLWTFDGPDVSWGGTSYAYDRSPGGTNTGTISGATPMIGKIGQALSFSGYNYVGIPDSAALSPESGNFTVSAWVKTNVLDSGQHWIWHNYGSNTNNLVNLTLDTSNKFITTFRDGSGNAAVATASPVLSTGQWYHVAGVRNGTTVKIYLNGAEQGTNTNSSLGTISVSDGTIPYIGVYADHGTFYWNGSIDEVRIYNRALSAGEVMSLYRMGGSKLK